VQDYIDAGVINVDATNLSLVNDTIKNATTATTDTTAEIQALIDNQSSPSTSTFTTTGAETGDLNSTNNYGVGVFLQVTDNEGNNFTTGGLSVKMWNEDTSNVTASISNVIDNKDGTYYVSVTNTVAFGVTVKASIEGVTLDGRAIANFYDHEPPVATTPSTALTIPENYVGDLITVTATDVTSIQYALAPAGSDNDNHLFEVNGSSGIVTFITPPDYEQPQDEGKNNNYAVKVYIYDSPGNLTVQTLGITVTDINDLIVIDDTIVFEGQAYESVLSPYTSRIWLDRNLGAQRAGASENDVAAFGDYYQWGRRKDGHQLIGAKSTTTLSSSISLTNNLKITIDDTEDWVEDGVDDSGADRTFAWENARPNDICPAGFEVSTKEELKSEINGYDVDNSDNAIDMFLKLTSNGYASAYDGKHYDNHELGKPEGKGLYSYQGFYWTRTPEDGDKRDAMIFIIGESDAKFYDFRRAVGAAVRCIQAL
jgi:uncharacterized protein (TIGR02145 family)